MHLGQMKHLDQIKFISNHSNNSKIEWQLFKIKNELLFFSVQIIYLIMIMQFVKIKVINKNAFRGLEDLQKLYRITQNHTQLHKIA